MHSRYMFCKERAFSGNQTHDLGVVNSQSDQIADSDSQYSFRSTNQPKRTICS